MEKITNQYVITRTPGKILICGGYLVISPLYRGLIFNSETYFKCEGKFLKLEKPSKKDGNLIIYVFSKNFNQGFKYELVIKHDFKLSQTEIYLDQIEGNENRFVESSIINSFYFFFLKNYNDIDKIITKFFNLAKENYLIFNLEADYRFYTYNKTYFDGEKTNKDEEKKINVKTGLGSSSGLICSLNTNILILLYQCFTENKERFKEISTLKQLSLEDQANILLSSYFSNNQAQKKIGSGFDIQSCLLGSQIFQRKQIDESFVSRILKEENSDISCLILNNSTHFKYLQYINDFLEFHLNNIKYIDFPLNFKACLISIECGSDTRLLVSKVLQWAEANKHKLIFDTEIFQTINKLNEKLIEIFEFNKELNYELISQVKNLNKELRKNLKLLSNYTEVEIQPEILTKLMDSLEEKGIIFSVCPGAGGFDGVFVMSFQNDFEIIVKNTIEELITLNSEFKAHFIPIKIIGKGTLIEFI